MQPGYANEKCPKISGNSLFSKPLLGTNSLIFQLGTTTIQSNFRIVESVPLVWRIARRFREHGDRSAVVGEIDHASTVCDIDTVRQEEVRTEQHVDGGSDITHANSGRGQFRAAGIRIELLHN
jgi:hypothetical protein